MTVRIILGVLVLCCVIRGILQLLQERPVSDAKDGTAQTTGNKELSLIHI